LHLPGARAATVLVVGDDANLSPLVETPLRDSGIEVVRVQTGREAEAIVARSLPDLVILDLVLSDTDTLVLLSKLKTLHQLPLMLVGRTQRRSDLELGMRLGADDFIAAPFTADELRVRASAVLKRSSLRALPTHAPVPDPLRPASQIRIGQLVVDSRSRTATIRGRELRLTPIEFRLLAVLAGTPERVMPRDEVLGRIWGPEMASSSRSFEVHLSRLRAKLRAAGKDSPRVDSIRISAFQLVDASSAPDPSADPTSG
jgi:DNA-binding response OmpR family regulator